MLSVDAKKVTTTHTYEVQRFSVRSQVTDPEVFLGSVDITTHATRNNYAALTDIVSDLWLGRRVADGREVEVRVVPTTFDAFQPKAYDVAGARLAELKLTASSIAVLACALVFGLSWPLVAATLLWAYYSLMMTKALPNQGSQLVTHDVKAAVPIEVAYYIDPTLPNPKEWGGRCYTVVKWEDGPTRLDPAEREAFTEAKYADPLAAFDRDTGGRYK